MAKVQLRGLRKTYGNFAAVDSIDLDISDGEFLVFLGPSGCGKTTTLRMIAGLVQPSSGNIFIGDRDVTETPVHQRNIGIVFQNYALFPHLTVYENVAYGLRRRRLGEVAIRKKVADVLSLVQMEELSERYPRALSGGQQQRVAIARALAIEPDVLLLDEPLSSLDAKLRLGVRRQIRELQHKLGITTILVTHDQDEAMSMGDRLAVLSAGKLQQIGEPREIYRTPANRFVADFIGTANFFSGTVAQDRRSITTPSGLQLFCADVLPGVTNVMVRPEAIRLSAAVSKDRSEIHGDVIDISYLGPVADVFVRLQSGDVITVRVDSLWADTANIVAHSEIAVRIPEEAIVVIS
ncbi:MAG: ABC transporter ATP-binding protein [Castellaniella sp.]|uniref:ABC transporter ATP-binding protein n=1 Tax=Castellaniella sp. TaxID=1955812 RepID=UPI00122B3818|nr:ABC transporter ATP-binding protein [Castellaniella sp.]TAN27324.1 MAG: ABC transporter ATP-binding protein [Castellaniella sp.]